MSLHLVDEDGKLETEKRLAEFLGGIAESALPPSSRGAGSATEKVGMNYHVVGVFGAQSSGKSTLLNHLFGTTFQMLDETVRRGQTTKGAFIASANMGLSGFEETDAAYATDSAAPAADGSSRMSRAAAAAAAADAGDAQPMKFPLLVLDFEGTDGLERGEDQSFERQLSLFGLCVADTLIINMWAVDVGRFNAANLSLLRTIFEVNLQLFSHDKYEVEEKPTLLIVLRDFTDPDPAPSLATMRKAFDTIWNSITRPPQFEMATIDDLFHIKYFVMPHYRLQYKEFLSAVDALRRWFGDSQSEDYLFSHHAMFRGVPLGGLPAYLSSCWETIRTSKDLDIPTQREMLAQHRCKQVKEQELAAFLTVTQQYEERLRRGEMLQRLSEVLDEAIEARLTAFYKQSKLYNAEVAAQYAAELETALLDASMRVVNQQSQIVAVELLSNIELRILNSVEDTLKQLLRSAQALPLTEREDPTIQEAAKALRAEGAAAALPSVDLMGKSQQMDSAACQQLIRGFWKTLSSRVKEVMNEVTAMPPQANLYGRFSTLIAEDPTTQFNVQSLVTDSVLQKIKSRMTSMADSASDTMHSGFEHNLTHNSDGTVRFISTAKGLQKIVPTALQSGLVVLGNLIYFRLKLLKAAESGTTCDLDSTERESRSARRVKGEHHHIVFQENDAEAAFYLIYSTLDSAPRYPYETSISTSSTPGEEEGYVAADCVLISQQATLRAYELYKQKCDFTTQLQLRTVETGQQRLPVWIYPAFLILGWNELWYVLTRPLLLVIVIAVSAVFLRQFFLSQWRIFEETGPAGVVIPAQMVIRAVGTVLRPILQFGQSVQGSLTRDGAVRSTSSSEEMRRKQTSQTHVDPASEETAVKTAASGTMRRRPANKSD